MVHFIEKVTPEIQKMVDCSFPNYHGKKFKVSTDVPSRLDSYWDGGSKTSYVFYSVDTGFTVPVESNHPMFESKNPNELHELPKGIILIAHSLFRGKDMGITFYVNALDVPPYLEAPKVDLPENVKIVLAFTRGLKSSYGGVSDYRYQNAKRKYQISKESWEAAKSEAILNGLLNKGGAITPAGRNSISDVPSNFTW